MQCHDVQVSERGGTVRSEPRGILSRSAIPIPISPIMTFITAVACHLCPVHRSHTLAPQCWDWGARVLELLVRVRKMSGLGDERGSERGSEVSGARSGARREISGHGEREFSVPRENQADRARQRDERARSGAQSGARQEMNGTQSGLGQRKMRGPRSGVRSGA